MIILYNPVSIFYFLDDQAKNKLAKLILFQIFLFLTKRLESEFKYVLAGILDMALLRRIL